MNDTLDAFDYVIVGAGSAGCVLANRLSEDPDTRVLLLEAGGKDWNPFIHIPIGFGVTLQSTSVNWQYSTVPDPGTNNRVHKWPRGKVLGGSSAINGLLYIRGNPGDYDGWAQLGLRGWSWDDVLPYFMKSEDFALGETAGHGVGGPLHVSNPVVTHPVADAIVRAGEQFGLSRNNDPNTGRQEGIGFYPVTIKNGRRVSAATAYLRPIRNRKNLLIATKSLAEKVLFEGRRAIGIRYQQSGKSKEAYVRREVLLCGGSINSPQLLELSGVGDGERLRNLGITVIKDSPGVGENLQDHFNTSVTFRLKPGTPSLNELSKGLLMMREWGKYLATRGGYFAIGAAHVMIFAKSRPELEWPDLQFHILPGSLDPEAFKNNKLAFDKDPGLTMGHYILRPESTGHVHLKSRNPREYPAILPNYLQSRADTATCVAGYRISREIASQPALEPLIESEFMPGKEVENDEQLLAHARENGVTLYHPVGTCKMGRPEDRMAVVDDRCRVLGVDGLRVVDASVMPKLVSGNTNAPTIMIAEKISDDIRGREPQARIANAPNQATTAAI